MASMAMYLGLLFVAVEYVVVCYYYYIYYYYCCC